MARYEVIERHRGRERVITTTRREQGAVNERDIAADNAYRNARKHAEFTGRAIYGSDAKDPNAISVVWFGDDFLRDWTYTYRRIGGEPTPDPEIDPEPWLASLIAVQSGSR